MAPSQTDGAAKRTTTQRIARALSPKRLLSRGRSKSPHRPTSPGEPLPPRSPAFSRPAKLTEADVLESHALALKELRQEVASRDARLEALRHELERKQEQHDQLHDNYTSLHAQLKVLTDAVASKMGADLPIRAPRMDCCAAVRGPPVAEPAPGLAAALQTPLKASKELWSSASSAVDAASLPLRREAAVLRREADAKWHEAGDKLHLGFERGLAEANAWSRDALQRLGLPSPVAPAESAAKKAGGTPVRRSSWRGRRG